MLPVIALVGRPNVGKSTLFNSLTRTRNALVADMPGLTRPPQCRRSRMGQVIRHDFSSVRKDSAPPYASNSRTRQVPAPGRLRGSKRARISSACSRMPRRP